MYEKLFWRKLLELYLIFCEVGILLSRFEWNLSLRDDNIDR
jgi:hypothetical protein